MIKDKIDSLIADAIKTKNSTKLTVLRNIKTEFTKFITSGSHKELTEEEEGKIIIKMINRSKDSINEYKKGNREDLVEEETEQIKILSEYAPKVLSEEEAEEIVKKAIDDYLSTQQNDYKISMKDTKKIIELSKQKNMMIDGKIVSKVIKEYV